VNWQYRTLLFEYQKDGLLGDRYIDDEEVEAKLNQEGQSGWELVSVTQIKDGLLAFCKRQEADISYESARKEYTDPVEPVSIHERTPITAEALQQEEKEHIRRLERQRQEVMKRQEQDIVGEIKIR
jgi:hypothetical protein